MESVRVNSELKKVNVTIWQWIARVVPILYIIISLLLHFIGLETLKDKWSVVGVSIVSFFAIIWWWWAMDTMSNIVGMFNENTKRYDDISQEIKEVRKEINNKK
tara:strand:+ start:40 stop:351 length:312 start_codon:yes stop_codon:yes gene_type:complete